MIKSSSKRPLLQREPTGGESSAGKTFVNGLMRATERVKTLVAVDGFRTCYKGEPYYCTEHERTVFRQFGWHRRNCSHSLVP